MPWWKWDKLKQNGWKQERQTHGWNTNHWSFTLVMSICRIKLEALKFLQYEIDSGLIYSKVYHRNPYVALSLVFCVDWWLHLELHFLSSILKQRSSHWFFHLDFTATREQWYYRHYVVCPRHHLYLLIWLSPVIVNQSHTPQIYVRKSLEMRNKVRNHSVATATNNIKVELFEHLNWIEFQF